MIWNSWKSPCGAILPRPWSDPAKGPAYCHQARLAFSVHSRPFEHQDVDEIMLARTDIFRIHALHRPLSRRSWRSGPSDISHTGPRGRSAFFGKPTEQGRLENFGDRLLLGYPIFKWRFRDLRTGSKIGQFSTLKPDCDNSMARALVRPHHGPDPLGVCITFCHYSSFPIVRNVRIVLRDAVGLSQITSWPALAIKLRSSGERTPDAAPAARHRSNCCMRQPSREQVQ